MKNIIAVLAISLSFTSAYAQQVKEIQAPLAVKSSFAKMFPGVKQAKWDKEGNLYKASYTNGHHKSSVLFDSTGKWIERETAIPVSQLSQKIKRYMQIHYKDEKLLGAAKITKVTSQSKYKVEIRGRDIYFTKEGDFIKEG
jgi:hypothetical protein